MGWSEAQKLKLKFQGNLDLSRSVGIIWQQERLVRLVIGWISFTANDFVVLHVTAGRRKEAIVVHIHLLVSAIEEIDSTASGRHSVASAAP